MSKHSDRLEKDQITDVPSGRKRDICVRTAQRNKYANAELFLPFVPLDTQKCQIAFYSYVIN